jgi:hypothetical protein
MAALVATRAPMVGLLTGMAGVKMRGAVMMMVASLGGGGERDAGEGEEET